MSAPVIPLLKQASFDPGTAVAIGQAFDMIIENLHARGQPLLVQEAIAQRVIEIARTGETDPTIISQRVLTTLGISRT
ncbi:MAG TPA: hypothetical protein VHD14_16360 [Pseudolabrys sp.]|jgi:hypothetical protein|nr:hypothetical protein [Pseudolabrys sp.]